MAKTELSNLEYISGVYKGLSPEKKEHVLNTARALLEIQDYTKYPDSSKTAPLGKKEEMPSSENLSAYPDK